MQLNIKPFQNIIRPRMKIEWANEHHKRFHENKKDNKRTQLEHNLDTNQPFYATSIRFFRINTNLSISTHVLR